MPNPYAPGGAASSRYAAPSSSAYRGVSASSRHAEFDKDTTWTRFQRWHPATSREKSSAAAFRYAESVAWSRRVARPASARTQSSSSQRQYGNDRSKREGERSDDCEVD